MGGIIVMQDRSGTASVVGRFPEAMHNESGKNSVRSIQERIRRPQPTIQKRNLPLLVNSNGTSPTSSFFATP
ncbi:hypothetical protein FJTKL_05784 [Diaporthe vaccinii]|uniref:Uncharacterized protein n=1 Tax=Diaporthe vaccinii TaxID=105482 RepID=A0ABR4EXV6_9PEZI